MSKRRRLKPSKPVDNTQVDPKPVDSASKPVDNTPPPLAGHVVDPQTPPKPLQSTLHAQHPIHGLFGDVFDSVGGVDRLADWAEDNYGDFIRIFAKMAPAPQPDNQPQQIQIQINNQLGPSPLDA